MRNSRENGADQKPQTLVFSGLKPRMLSLVLLVAAVSVATGRSPPSTMFGVTLNMGGKHDVSAVGLIDTAT
jgi:hypothetical protein